MKVEKLSQFEKTERYNQVMKRSKASYEELLPKVSKIIKDVKQNGDKAVLKYTKQFDKVDLEDCRVSNQEIKQAYDQIDNDFLPALQQAINNITAVHKKQLPTSVEEVVEPVEGVEVWKRWRPIEKVGLYVPGGKAVYPASLLMSVIPAQIAGCKEIVIVTPPQSDGNASPYVLVAADKLGIRNIFKVGGIQAVAALAYGTESIPKVYKIFGPGNSYVTAAKLAVYMDGEVAIDSPAGPSEVFVIADQTANAKFIAADLICDAEHGDDSASVLVSTSEKLVNNVINEIKNILPKLSTVERIKSSLDIYGLFAVVDSLEEAVEFANNYAPEHIHIMTKDAKQMANEINNAGSVFVGDYTCKSAGDYGTGANHVLPTGGAAKMFSGLSVLDFMRLVEFQQASKSGLKQISSCIQKFAEVEGFPAHKYSCSVRFE